MIIKWSDDVMTNAGHCPTCGAKLDNSNDTIELYAGDLHCKNCGCYVGSRKGFGTIKFSGKGFGITKILGKDRT